MSRGDAYEDEVHSLRHISDEDADRLLRGDLPAGDRALDELAAFVQDVGVAYSAPPTEPVQARHLDAMRRAARPRAAGWNPSAEPAEAGSAPGRDGPGLPERALRILAGLTPRPGLAGAAAALAVCLAFSTLTALGRLPEPVQAAVAGAARAVGVSVPDPNEEGRPAEQRPREQQHVKPAGPASRAAPQPAPAIGRRSVPPPGESVPETGGSATPSDGMSDLPTTTTPDAPAATPPDEPPSHTPPEAPAEPGSPPPPEPGGNGDQSGAPSQSPLPVP
jgi:hypothetical protein